MSVISKVLKCNNCKVSKEEVVFCKVHYRELKETDWTRDYI